MPVLTEDEAREKICPFRPLPAQRYGEAMCIGARCMVWEWGPRDPLPGENRLATALRDDPPTRGYCGASTKRI